MIPTMSGSGCGNFVGGWEFSDTIILAGGTFGGVVETIFAPNWSAQLEFLYAKFGSTTPDFRQAVRRSSHSSTI
jgi:hypothetical protein